MRGVGDQPEIRGVEGCAALLHTAVAIGSQTRGALGRVLGVFIIGVIGLAGSGLFGVT